MRPIVSIVTPACNAANFIARSIESALAQTLTEIEVVVVDDASIDDTVAIVEGIANRDPRVRLLRHDQNRGVSAARNRAIAAAQGDWITLLDSDDTYAPERLCRLLEHATRTSAEMVADNVMLTSYPATKHLHLGIAPEGRLFDGPISLPDFLEHSTPGSPYFGLSYLKPIFQRAFIQNRGLRYRENMRAYEDFVFYVDCLVAGANFQLVPAAYYFYSIRPGSLCCDTAENYSARHGADLICEFLNHPTVATRADWLEAFLARQARTELHLSYEAWVKILKEPNLIRAGLMLVAHHHVAPVYMRHILAAIVRRLRNQPRAIPMTLQHCRQRTTSKSRLA
jgi:succinoglycan biosynthesis protein ExoO